MVKEENIYELEYDDEIENNEEIEENKDPYGNNNSPDNELEFNDKLITPSSHLRKVPTISRELMSTNLTDTFVKNIIHYDNVEVKYDLIRYTQKQRVKDFERNLKEKIKRSMIYGFPFKVHSREWKGGHVGYSRKIHMMVATAKSFNGYNLKTIKTNYNVSSEESTTTSIERNLTEKKKRGIF